MNFGFWILTQVLYFLLRLVGCCHGYTHEVCLNLSVLLESRLNWLFFLSLTSVAFEMSNPSSKNQHGIKKCMALILYFRVINTIYFRSSRQRAASCVRTIQPRKEWEQSQWRRAAGKIDQTVSWAQYSVRVLYTLPTHVLTIWRTGSVHCLLYGRGWVLLVCARTPQRPRSVLKHYWT